VTSPPALVESGTHTGSAAPTQLSFPRAFFDRDRKRREEKKAELELRSRYESLTPREREVMSLVAAGLLNKQIAGELGLSEITVKIHRGHAMKKMRPAP